MAPFHLGVGAVSALLCQSRASFAQDSSLVPGLTGSIRNTALSPPAWGGGDSSVPTTRPGVGLNDSRRLAEKVSVGGVLLEMMAPGHLGGDIGSKTTQRPSSIGGGDGAPSASGLGGGGPGGGGGRYDPEAPFEAPAAATTLLAEALTRAWETRSCFRPSASGAAAPAALSAAAAPTAYAEAAAAAVAMSRLPTASPKLLPAMFQARPHVPWTEPVAAQAASAFALNGSRPLLALIHPSTIAWPARLDTIVAALLALENAPAGAGAYDLVVVLDSKGEAKSKHDCNAKVGPRSLGRWHMKGGAGVAPRRFLFVHPPPSSSFVRPSSLS